MAQFISDERCELEVPLAQRLVTDLNAALVEQLLDVTLTQGHPWYSRKVC